MGGSAEVLEVLVTDGTPIIDTTRREADARGLLHEDVLVVAIERDHEVITPRGQTTIRQGDVVTVFSESGFTAVVLELFGGQADRMS